jgi:hypothetical protein
VTVAEAPFVLVTSTGVVGITAVYSVLTIEALATRAEAVRV